MTRYADAGVDEEGAARLLARLRRRAPAIGGFAGLFPLPAGGERLLVAATDGVGTKVEVARAAGRFDTIGTDLLAMCANDVVALGARPLFFLDYVAVERLDEAILAPLLDGIACACARAGCLLLGGETAQMPGVYLPGRFDLAGFCVGEAAPEEIIDGASIAPGHLLVGLPSSGLHSNGFSLVRRLLFEERGLSLDTAGPEGRPLADTLLEPTRLYGAEVLPLHRARPLAGIAHITGGGWQNIARLLRPGLTWRRDPAYEAPPLFRWLQALGPVPEEEMWTTFNMGVGMVLVTEPADAPRLVAACPGAAVVGDIVAA